jgi:hypothetical protein
MSAAKLTLKLDQAVIERTKEYAKERHLSLSGMVENYFRALTGSRPAQRQLTPLVRELSGVAPAKAGRRWKQAYADYLTKKYSG